MGLYNFDPQFVPGIRSGIILHTIRRHRAHPDKPGNTLHLYMGLRTRSVELITRVICTRIEEIRIRRQPVGIYLGGELLSPDECEIFAQQDGCYTFAQMMECWHGRLPFEGVVLYWKPERK
jgi:hypothetical protein